MFLQSGSWYTQYNCRTSDMWEKIVVQTCIFNKNIFTIFCEFYYYGILSIVHNVLQNHVQNYHNFHFIICFNWNLCQRERLFSSESKLSVSQKCEGNDKFYVLFKVFFPYIVIWFLLYNIKKHWFLKVKSSQGYICDL